MRTLSFVCGLVALLVASSAERLPAQPAPRFPEVWIHGEDCEHSADRPFQEHPFDDDTYILRQNKCATFEAPFLYLLLGRDRAFLFDTGARPAEGQPFPLRETVERLIARRLATRGSSARSLPLVVAHSHAHGDHVFGDVLWRGAAAVTVVPPNVDGVRKVFGITNWPSGQARLDLGGRVLTIVPIPGHERSHVAVYDATTKILLTGDTLYPGFLVVENWPEYRRSVRRLADFARQVGVAHVLGAHVEMTRERGVAYPYGTKFQPDEHVLQLTAAHLQELSDACERMGESPSPGRYVHDSFIIEVR